MANERYAVTWCSVSRCYYRLKLSGSTVEEIAACWRSDGRDYWDKYLCISAGCPIPDEQIKPPPPSEMPAALTELPVLHTAVPLRACMACGSRRLGGCDCLRSVLPCTAEHRYQCIYCRNMRLVTIVDIQ